MARAYLLLLVVVAGCWDGLYSAAPNIVYILGDDLGWNDVGFHNEKVLTPHIDNLAAKGIELTSSYVQTVCTASRSALMTGRYPIHNGLQHLVLQPNGKSCLPEQKTMPQYLQDAGYTTKMVGKWHLGYCNDQCLPKQRGFDEFIGMVGGECDYLKYEDKDVMLKYTGNTPDGTGRDEVHMTIKDETDAVNMIKAHKGSNQPMFLYVSPNAPHTPLEPTDDMYDVHDFLNPDDPDEDARRKYLGLVAGLDDLVGAVVEALEDADMSDNTIIIFQSDNGGSSIAPLTPGFESVGNNYPLRNGKFSHFEGGVRSPTIYYDPRLKECEQGTKRDFLFHVSDWLPTFLGLAGSTITPTEIDGINQVSNLQDSYNTDDKYKVRDRMLVRMDTISPIPTINKCTDRDSAFRYQDWKLVTGRRTSWSFQEFGVDEYRKPEESPELETITGDSCIGAGAHGMAIKCLFNIKDDPSETTNLYYSQPEVVDQLMAMVDDIRANIKQNVYRNGVANNDENTKEFDGYLIPQANYCEPSEFPLEPTAASCQEATDDCLYV